MEVTHQKLLFGIQTLNLTVSDAQVDKLLAFIKLLAKWNKAYNLTAINKPEDMVTLHLLDSLAVLPYISGSRVLDIATGAGLPGIPLAICCLDKDFVLLDSNAKKTRFVQQAILELKLGNVSVFHSRVEDYNCELGFDIVITRAFAALGEIANASCHLLAEQGYILAMKAHVSDEELAQIAGAKTVIPIQVPDLEAPRCLIKIPASHKTR